MGQTASSTNAGNAGAGGPGGSGALASAGRDQASDRGSQIVQPPLLDLTEVYPRILISGLPYNAVTSVGSHRNNAAQLAKHLDDSYGANKYLLFNLAPEERVTYDPLLFKGQVVRFPPVLSDADCNYDDGLPTVAQTFQICYALSFFLNLSEDHVVVLHDISGRTRSAFVVACFLGWMLPREWTVPGAFSHIQTLRGSRFSLPTSWFQQLNAFQLCVQQPRALRPRKLMLMKLMASLSGPVEKMASRPIIRVFESGGGGDDDTGGGVTAGGVCVWDSEIDVDPLSDDAESEAIDVVLEGEEEDDEDGSGGAPRLHRRRPQPKHNASFVWDEGELKATVERYVQGDVQLFIFAETVQRRQMHLFPTPSGEMPDTSGLMDGSAEANSIYEERRVRSCIARYSFHTNMLGEGPLITVQLGSSHVDLPQRGMVTPEAFKLMLVLHEEKEEEEEDGNDDGNEEDEQKEEDEAAAELAQEAGKAPPALVVEYEGTPPADDPLLLAGLISSSSAIVTASANGKQITAANSSKKQPQQRRRSRRRKPRKPRPDDVHVFETGNINWSFAACLNLRGRRSFLAGLFYLSEAHHVFPEASGITMLMNQVAAFAPRGTPLNFFIAAFQIADRDVDKAARLLKTDFMLALMDCTRQKVPGQAQTLTDAELGSGGYKRLFERPWLSGEEEEEEEGPEEAAAGAAQGDGGEAEAGSGEGGKPRKTKRKLRYPRRAGTRGPLPGTSGTAAGGDGGQHAGNGDENEDDEEDEDDLDDEPFGAFNIQEKAREKAMIAATRKPSASSQLAAAGGGSSDGGSSKPQLLKRASTISIGGAGGQIVLGEDDEEETTSSDDDDDDNSGADSATATAEAGKALGGRRHQHRRHGGGAGVRRGSGGPVASPAAIQGLAAALEERKARGSKKRKHHRRDGDKEAADGSFADDLTRSFHKSKSARKRDRALRAAAARGDRTTGLVFLGDPSVHRDGGGFDDEGSSIDDNSYDSSYSDSDEDEEEEGRTTGESTPSVRAQDRWEKQKRAVLAGPIAQLMIPVISTALADLAHKAELAAASTSTVVSTTAAAVEDEAAKAQKDAETQIALHEGAHSFLVKSVSALQSVANDVGAVAATVAAAASEADSAANANDDHPLADAVKEHEARSRSGTAASTRSLTLNDLPEKGKKQAQSIAAVQVELTSKPEPSLYAAALHIATSVLHAERSEVANAAFQAAQIADTTGDTELAITTRSRLIQSAINGFSKLDVHAMSLLLESVRVIVSGGALKPILRNTPELAVDAKPLSPPPSAAALSDEERQQQEAKEEEEYRHHLLAKASSLVTSLLTQNPHLQGMHSALVLQLEGDVAKGTAVVSPKGVPSSSSSKRLGRASSMGGALLGAVTSSFAFGAALDLKARLQATASSALRSLITPPTPPHPSLATSDDGTSADDGGGIGGSGSGFPSPSGGAGGAGGSANAGAGAGGAGGGRSRAASSLAGIAGGAGGSNESQPLLVIPGAPALSISALKALGMSEDQTKLIVDLLAKQQQAAAPAAAGGGGGNEASAVALLLPLLASLAARASENTNTNTNASAAVPAPAATATASAAPEAPKAAEPPAPPPAAAGPMGALLAGIRSKRKPEGAEEAEKKPEESAAAASPAPAPAASSSPEINETLQKYAKMLKMGIPEPAVRIKMKNDGLIPDADLDSAFEKVKRIKEGKPASPADASAAVGVAGSETPSPAGSEASASTAATDATTAASEGGPDISKYEKMLKMGIPPSAAQHKMKADGVTAPEALKAFVEACKRLGKPTDGLDDGSGGAAGAEGGSAADEWKKKKAEKEAKAKEEAAAKESEANAAKDRASAEALALEEARKTRIAELLQEQLAVIAEKDKPLKDTEQYGKYFKMKRMGVPDAVIEHKLVMAGLDPGVLRQDENLPLQGYVLVPLKEDGLYGKFFRMLKVGLPKDAVAHKMAAEGANALALELNPDLPAPAGLSDLSTGLVLSQQRRQQIAAQFDKPTQPAKPKKQRKKLHWEALPESRIASKDTIWGAAASSITSGEGGAVGELIDDDELQALFTQDVVTTTTTSAASKAAKEGAGGAGAASKTLVYLIDMKRGRNVGIGIKRIKMPLDLLRKCLLNLTRFATAPVPPSADGEPSAPPTQYSLSQEDLILVEELLPTPEEISVVRSYRGDKSRLGEAEKFFLAVADVPKPKQRAQALSFQCVFDASETLLTEQVTTVRRACEQTRTSARLRKVLEATLLLGNKLNADEEAGAASAASNGGGSGGNKIKVKGFSISSLLKLSQTKAYTSSKLTLLHYLASRLRKIDPSVMVISEELLALPAASRLTLEMLRADLASMKTGLSTVEKLVRETVRHEATMMHRGRAGSTVTGAAIAAVAAASSPGSSPLKSAGRNRAGSTAVGSPTGAARAGAGAGAGTGSGETTAGFSAKDAPASSSSSAATPANPRVLSRSSYLEDVTGLMAAEMDAAVEAVTGSVGSPSASSSASAATASSSSQQQPAAPVAEALPDFVARAQARVAGLQSELDGASSAFSSLLEFFGEESTSMSVESFFTTLNSFVMAFQKADQENIEEEKKKQKEAARKAAKEGTPVKPSSSPDASSGLSSSLSSSSSLAGKAGAGTLTPLLVPSGSSTGSVEGATPTAAPSAVTSTPGGGALASAASNSSSSSSSSSSSESGAGGEGAGRHHAASSSAFSPSVVSGASVRDSSDDDDSSAPAAAVQRTPSLGAAAKPDIGSPFSTVLSAIAARKGGMEERGGLGVASPAAPAAAPAPEEPAAAPAPAPAGPPPRKSIGLSSLLGGAGGAATFADRQNSLLAAIKARQQKENGGE